MLNIPTIEEIEAAMTRAMRPLHDRIAQLEAHLSKESEYLTFPEFCEKSHQSPGTVRAKLRRGEIAHTRTGEGKCSRYRIPRSELKIHSHE